MATRTSRGTGAIAEVKRLVLRLIVALCAAGMAALVATLVIAVADLYLVGHGHGSLLRESISWPAAAVYLSVGDLLLIGAVLLAATGGWALTGRKR